VSFSPGPWRWGPDHAEPNVEPIGTVWGNGQGADRVASCVREGNARLIAAAPEMYELLEILSEYEHRWTCPDDWCGVLEPKLHALLARIDAKETPG
jgi:hypothetical protein